MLMNGIKRRNNLIAILHKNSIVLFIKPAQVFRMLNVYIFIHYGKLIDGAVRQ